MAETTLAPDTADTKPGTQIHELGLKVQKATRRIKLLCQAVDDLSERLVPEPDAYKLKALSNIDDIMSMIDELADDARDHGEEIERLGGRLSYEEGKRHG
jgi:hypothetical protein